VPISKHEAMSSNHSTTTNHPPSQKKKKKKKKTQRQTPFEKQQIAQHKLEWQGGHGMMYFKP
jgi:hypothetical protein